MVQYIHDGPIELSVWSDSMDTGCVVIIDIGFGTSTESGHLRGKEMNIIGVVLLILMPRRVLHRVPIPETRTEPARTDGYGSGLEQARKVRFGFGLDFS